jgi:ADP-ribose pyrophosphatase YjhB (NUDIX family)
VTAGRDYIGVSCAFICHDGQGRFLLQKRGVKTRDEQGTWEGGAGQLEFGENFDQAVLREVKEEFGCQGELQDQLPAFSLVREKDGAKSHWVCVAFMVKVNPNEVKNNEPDYIDEIGWFKLNDFPANLHTGLQWALKLYPEYFNKYAN